MKLYLYLKPTQLEVLRQACLPFTPITQRPDPFEWNRASIEKKPEFRPISDEEFHQELKRQYQALPEAMRALVKFDYFCMQCAQKRPQIEAGMRKQSQPKAKVLPDTSQYKTLARCRFFKRMTNPLLWDRYAHQYAGLVLEFEGRHPYFSASKNQWLTPVTYTKERPSAQKQGHLFPGLSHAPLEYAAEEEIRLIRPQAQAKHKDDTGLCWYPFPPQALLSVTVGLHMSPAILTQVRRLLEYDMRYKGKALRRLRLDPDEFKLHTRATL